MPKHAWPLAHLPIGRLNSLGVCPRVQINPAIDDLTAQLVECWPHAFVTPLRQLVAVANDVQFIIAKNIVSVLLE